MNDDNRAFLPMYSRVGKSTVVPTNLLVQYPPFKLSAVYRDPKKKLKIKETNGL
jgi:hypothetical protein